jgi:hypothetical protein
MSSGVKARADKGPQPIKIFWLLDELKKRKIPQRPFAERLGITVNVLNGKVGIFPADKVAECMRLLDNWDGSTITNNSDNGGRKTTVHPWHGPAFSNGKRL